MKFIDSIPNYPRNDDSTEEEKKERVNIIRRFVTKCKVAGVKIYLLDYDWYKK